jgi:uncharacterized protein (TIGR00730 family)
MAGICVFCGSRSGEDGRYTDAARLLGECLAIHHHTLIYGGGGTGVMGTLADAVLRNRGRIIGVIPGHLAKVELMHPQVADMRVTVDMHERKAAMHELADVYVILPGGFGTMEELFEAVTWAQLELHSRPIAILNVAGLYDGLLTLFDSMESAGFLSARCRSLVNVFTTTGALLDWIGQVTAPADR